MFSSFQHAIVIQTVQRHSTVSATLESVSVYQELEAINVTVVIEAQLAKYRIVSLVESALITGIALSRN